MTDQTLRREARSRCRVCSLFSALRFLIWKGCGDGGHRVASYPSRGVLPKELRVSRASRQDHPEPRPGLLSVLCPLIPALRKEVIQPQVPLRLPCYDFTPVADLTVDGCFPCGLAHRLRVKPTPMV